MDAKQQQGKMFDDKASSLTGKRWGKKEGSRIMTLLAQEKV